MNRLTTLSLCLALPSLTGCDAIQSDKNGPYICVNDLLDMAGLTRADLGIASDEAMKELIETQEAVIGTAIIRDCQAAAGADSLSEAVESAGSGGSDGVPEPESETHSAEDADGAASVVDDIVESIVTESGGEVVDVAILLDTTGSMTDDTAAVSEQLATIIERVTSNGGRIALASYGDNYSCDDPWYDVNDGGLIDTSSMTVEEVEAVLNTGITQTGGCDWPESMYDGIYKTADELEWTSSASRTIIVLTDAEAKEPPESTYGEADVAARLAQDGISLDLIIVGVSY